MMIDIIIIDIDDPPGYMSGYSPPRLHGSTAQSLMHASPTPDGCYQIPVLPSGIFWAYQHTMGGSGGALSIFCYVLA